MSGNKLIDDYLSELMDDGAPEPAPTPAAGTGTPAPADAGVDAGAGAGPGAADTASDPQGRDDAGGTIEASELPAEVSEAEGSGALAPPDSGPSTPEPPADPLAAFRSGGRDISDDEFEAMLDVLQGKPATPPATSGDSVAAAETPAADAPPPADPLAAFRDGGREISDDEFEAMLDVLGGKAAPPAVPAAAAATPAAPPAADSAPAAIVSSDQTARVSTSPEPAALEHIPRGRPTAAAPGAALTATGAPAPATYLDSLPARQAEQLLPTGAARSPLISPEPKAERHRRAEERISSWLRFSLGRQSFAVEVLKVQEVLRLSAILPVRGTDPAMLGVMNLRGQIVPVLDLALKLGFPSAPPTDASRIIVLEESGETLGLLVASVADVTNVSEARIEKIGGTPSLVAAEVVRGVARRDGHIIIMLDASRLLA